MVDAHGMPDLRTVVAAQLGDHAALDAVLRAVQQPLWRHLAYLLRSDDDADDALQDTLLTVARKIGTVRDPRWFRAWAFRVATRVALRRGRRGSSAPVFVALADDAAEAPAADEPPFDDALLATLPSVLAEVPPASQLVLRMHYEHGLTHVEIAEALDISLGTVKSRHHYGLQWLRRRLAAGGAA